MKVAIVILAFAFVLAGCSSGTGGSTTNAVSEIKQSAGHSTAKVNPNLPKPMGAGGGPPSGGGEGAKNPKFRHSSM